MKEKSAGREEKKGSSDEICKLQAKRLANNLKKREGARAPLEATIGTVGPHSAKS